MEQATNLFTKGLQLDTHPMVLSNDTLTDCLNGTLITMNGNEVILLNDMGNRRVDKAFLPPGYEPVGIKEYGGIIYVASYNPITNKSQIGSFPSPLRKISSNNKGESPIFDFDSFTNGSNVVYDLNLGLNVLKSDSFMFPLTRDLTLRAGDKFAVYANGLSLIAGLLTNYNNIDNRFPNKAYSPKNRKYTLLLGVLNSLNEFVDISKTLCRWKIINGTWLPISYNSDVSEIYKFNDGYFISDSFSTSFNEETIEDSKLIKERLKIAANTYAYKLVGPLYLKIVINHIDNFNYNIYGVYDYTNKNATLWIEGFLTYNCPDGATTIISNSNEDYGTFDENIPSNNFGFNLIGREPINTLIEKSVYNPSNNTYTVKIVKKYTNIIGTREGTIFDYVLGVKADKDNSSVYLRGLSVKGSIDLSLLGSGDLKFNGWRFYNDYNKQTSLLTFAFNAYPEYGKTFDNLRFKFIELNNTNNVFYYPKQEYDGLPIYNGKQTLNFGWSEIGLLPRKTYMVLATYRIRDNKSGTYDYISISIPEELGIVRWFLTTELFNEFYPGSSGILDFCNVSRYNHLNFYNKMKVNITNISSVKKQDRESQEFEGNLLTFSQKSISYLCKHTHKVDITTNPIISIKDEEKYPTYINIPEDKKKSLEISNVTVSLLGNKPNPEFDEKVGKVINYSNSFREQLFIVEGRDLKTVEGLNPANNLENLKLLESSLEFSGKQIWGEIYHYDAFKACGETVDNLYNAFDKYSKILDKNHVFPSDGHYGGVIADYDQHTGPDDDHYIEVAIKQSSDTVGLPGDHDLPSNWYEIFGDDDDDPVLFEISSHLGSIYLHFTSSVKDSDITFLYIFCRSNKFFANKNISVDTPGGKSAEMYARVWWMMPNGEWACFPGLYRKSNNLASFIKSQLGNKELVYCMYDTYTENDFIYIPKENFIYYDRYNIPLTYTINYKLPTSINNVVSGCTSAYYCGNLRFEASIPELTKDNVEFNLKSLEKFYDNINSISSQQISNIFIGDDYLARGTMTDSLNRPLNPSYVYYLDNGKLHRIDNPDFYVDTVNKTRLDGANRLLYNLTKKGSVEDKYQTAGADDDSFTIIDYNLLNLVAPV